MLEKSQRIRRNEEFDQIFRFGRAIFFEEVVCRFLRKPEGAFRLGFSLSKKHVPRAVDRNRFRRVLSALIAEAHDALPPTTDAVFSLRRKVKILGKKDYAPALDYFLKEMSKPKK